MPFIGCLFLIVVTNHVYFLFTLPSFSHMLLPLGDMHTESGGSPKTALLLAAASLRFHMTRRVLVSGAGVFEADV